MLEEWEFGSDERRILLDHQSGPRGLDSIEAEKRLNQYGFNIVFAQKKKSLLYLFIEKFKSPLVLLLLFASFFSAVIHSTVDFVMIAIMILISISLDTFLEHQSEKAADALRKKVQLKSRVLRNGKIVEIPSIDLTIGDIVFVKAGNVVPAEMQMVTVRDLHIDESALTGESFPVEKQVSEAIYMGTLVINGEGAAVVTAVGQETRYGKIAESISKVRPETDFEKGIRDFGYLIMKIAIVIVMVIFLINALTKGSLSESFLFALAVAVGLTPEMLPMIMTINLAKGALRMSRKGVIVKHLPAIHNLGSMDVLCTDKTGTLTESKIQLERHDDIGGKSSQKVLEYAFLNCHFQSNLISPLDEAVLRHNEIKYEDYQKIDEIPFDFFRKRLSVIIKTGSKTILICKGALEELSPKLVAYEFNKKILKLDDQDRQKIEEHYQELSKEGYRVIAVAYREIKELKTVFNKEDEGELVFLGLTAFLDPPKHTAKETIQALEKEGIALKVLTGDNEFVSKKVCQELDFPMTGVITGSELQGISEEKLFELVRVNNIFTKLTPDQKLLIISSLQKQGSVVGYLGDGINDATALRQSDVGISVENAVDVAKETADLILVNKSLGVLRDGVMEGRKTFANTTKYIFMNFGSNFGDMISLSIGSVLLPFLPMLPIQIILNNLLYDLSQLTLPSDNVDAKDVSRPLRWDIKMIKRFIFRFGGLSSIFDLLTFGALAVYFRASQPVFQTGWFIETLATQALVMLTLRTKIVPSFKSRPSNWIVASAILLVIVSIALAIGPLANVFGFAPLPLGFWIFLIVVIVANYFMNELTKIRFYGARVAFNKELKLSER